MQNNPVVVCEDCGEEVPINLLKPSFDEYLVCPTCLEKEQEEIEIQAEQEFWDLYNSWY